MKTKTNGRMTAARRQRQANIINEIHKHSDHFDRHDSDDDGFS